MCGIVGYLGSDLFIEYILSGLKLLQNRGYDSVGLCYLEDRELSIIKYASTNNEDSLELLERKVLDLDIKKQNGIFASIGHTRWATHGARTNINAHPHIDNKNRISLVHNGIIENFQELKTQLLEEGYVFHSQTDSEVIAVLIGKYLDEGETMNSAIKKTVSRLYGTWALVIMNKESPNKLWITRNGSPLLLGMENDFIMIVSEQIAFSNYIKKYIVIDNHDIIEISKENGSIQYNKNIQRYVVNEKNTSEIDFVPREHKHWMLKEITEQPDSIIRAINNGGRIENGKCVKLGGLDSCKERLLEIHNLILLGCGTSYHAGLWSMDIFKSLDIFDTVSCFDGAEFNIKDVPKKGKTGVILLSQSGETKDLHRCIQIAKDNELITIGVVNVIDSLMARETDCGVYLNAGREVSVASTKSFTNQCVVLTMIAVWFSQNRETCLEKRRTIISDLRNLSFQMNSLLEKIEDAKNIVKAIIGKTSLFILGKGKEEAIAKEGSLKMKEVAYIHAEGYSSSALKHGAFALIEEDLPVILIDIGEENRDKNKNAYHEIHSRGAFIVRITDDFSNDIFGENNKIVIEQNRTFGGVLANIYIQALGYYIAIEKGHNPDRPKNLAKVVTVE